MREFLIKICVAVGNFIGVDKKIAAGIIAGVGVLLLIAFIAIIVAVSKKKKAKKAKLATTQKASVSAPDNSNKVSEQKIENTEAVASVQEEKIEPTTEQVVESSNIEQSANVKEEQNKTSTATTKKSVAKTTGKSKTATKDTAEKTAKRLNGKWIIEEKKSDEYIALLTASNGEVMLTGESYTTADGAKNGIATIIKGIENGNFIVYKEKSGGYFYKLKSAGNKLLCVGEVYSTKDGCQKAIESVKRFGSSAVIVNEVVTSNEYIDYVPLQVDYEIKKGARGKWKIEKTEGGKFCAKLYANNGQLMLATEEVSQIATAKKAIESVKKNCQEGNFVIDKDKFGQFYYKLRNSKRTVICVGESYGTLEGCINALESVRKFAAISLLAES